MVFIKPPCWQILDLRSAKNSTDDNISVGLFRAPWRRLWADSGCQGSDVTAQTAVVRQTPHQRNTSQWNERNTRTLHERNIYWAELDQIKSSRGKVLTIRGNKSIQFESRQLNERKVNHMDYIDAGAFEKQKTLSVPVRNCSANIISTKSNSFSSKVSF